MLHDLRYAIRLLGRNPVFTIATTLTLALAIGGTTAMFTVVDAAGTGEPERVPGRLVSAGLFETLGVLPAMGRSFAKTDEDAENAEVAVLSDGLWRRRFGADPSILGRRVTVDGARSPSSE